MRYLIVILMTGGLVLIHELGHFFMARLMRIPVARFSIGFGPKLWMFKRKDTEYRRELKDYLMKIVPPMDQLGS